MPLTGATVAFTVQPAAGTADATAVSEAQRPDETVDSLMAEINPPRPAAGRRMPLTVPDPQQPSLNQPSAASRASLFDLPDPSAPEADPFAPQSASGSGGATASRPDCSGACSGATARRRPQLLGHRPRSTGGTRRARCPRSSGAGGKPL